MLSSLTRISLGPRPHPRSPFSHRSRRPPQSNDAPLALPGLARTHAPHPTAAAITEEDLKTRLYIVADDSMQGREAGTHGGARANAYLVRELTRLGLTPAGDGGTFLQTIPLSIREPDTTSTLRIDGAAGQLRQFYDWVLVPRIGLQTFLGGQPYRWLLQRDQRANRLRRTHRYEYAASAGRRARSRRRLHRAARRQRATSDRILAARQSARVSRRGGGARRRRDRRRRAPILPLSARRVRRPHEACARAHRAARHEQARRVDLRSFARLARRRRGGKADHRTRGLRRPSNRCARAERRRHSSGQRSRAAPRVRRDRVAHRPCRDGRRARPRLGARRQRHRARARRRRSPAAPHRCAARARAHRARQRASRASCTRRLDCQRCRRRRQRRGDRARAGRGSSRARKQSRSARCSSSGTPRRRRGCSARSTTPIIRPFHAIRSSRR